MIVALSAHFDESHPGIRTQLDSFRHPEAAGTESSSKNSESQLSSDWLLAQTARQFRVLTKPEEQQLFKTIKTGLTRYAALRRTSDSSAVELDTLNPADEAAFIQLAAAYKTVFYTNLRLVIKVARPYLRARRESRADILHYGCEGLARAIHSFRVGRGYAFSTYGTPAIRSHIIDQLPRVSSQDYIPRHLRPAFDAFREAEASLVEELGRSPSVAEIALRSGLDRAEVIGFLHRRKPAISLNKVIHQNRGRDEKELGDSLPAGVAEPIANPEAAARVAALMASRGLTAREQLVIALRYGLEPATIGDPLVQTASGELPYSTV